MKPVILLVEDNDDDAELTRMAFDRARVENALVRVYDGVEALDYLFRRGAHAERGPDSDPAVVLLDINLPRIDGLEVLRTVRADPSTKHVPIVMLTSSNADRDRLAAYEGHANSFIQKPVDFDRFIVAAREIGLYWLVLNQRAPRAP
ncbi:MAG: response regulator [Deltaproteobacteria bacterium]|nr:response regulator [Deltaproteobacteria bacterium]MCW5802579.1 response regulator [Deltaproteobacteria bacterium]